MVAGAITAIAGILEFSILFGGSDQEDFERIRRLRAPEDNRVVTVAG
jgi:hypothetical protein